MTLLIRRGLVTQQEKEQAKQAVAEHMERRNHPDPSEVPQPQVPSTNQSEAVE